jgi:hypothetical protein
MPVMSLRDDDLLVRLNRARGFGRVIVAAALGDSQGETGPDALRGLLAITGKGTSDLRCAAVLALAKRCREEGTEDYAAALDIRDGATKDYAMIAMAAFGTDGHWDRVFGGLRKKLTRRRNRQDERLTDLQPVLVYLCRHLNDDTSRTTKLVETLRARWDSLLSRQEEWDPDEVTWLLNYWPDVAPDGPAPAAVAPPDSAGMTAWIRSSPLLTHKPYSHELKGI